MFMFIMFAKQVLASCVGVPCVVTGISNGTPPAATITATTWPLQDIVSLRRGFMLYCTLHNNILCKHHLYCAIYCILCNITNYCTPRTILRCF